MADIEKVIYDIERCICHVPDACRDCSHYGYDRMECMESLLKDALELLKEQPHIVHCENCRKLGTDVCPVFSPKNDWFCADGVKQQK